MKTYQVTYKLIHNEDASKEFFHDKWIHPLYVSLTYNRRPTKYRCRLFDLFLKPKYGLRIAQDVIAPDINVIKQREENLIEYIINKNADDFSFEVFKKDYDYYSTDLLSEMEAEFISFLYTYLNDVGMPYLATVLTDEAVCEKVSIYEVVQDMKLQMKPDHYEGLIESSVAYSHPYFPVSQFLENSMKHPYAITIADCENPDFLKDLSAYLKKHYKEHSKKLLESFSQYEAKARL